MKTRLLSDLAQTATTHFTATVSNPLGLTLDWVKISVDGATPVAATMTVGNPNNYYIDWPSSEALNPSEHTVEATAQIHDSLGTVPLDSTASLGNDRVADDIIADVRLQSLKFNNSITLNTDATTAVPSPQYTWNPATNALLTSNPAAYIQGSAASLTMVLGSLAGAPLTGTTPIGYALKLQANPNTTGPAVGNPPVTPPPDPVLTLYDNTTSTPFVPTVCTSSATVNATTVLDAWVAKYTTTIPTLNFYVKFTSVTPAVWRMVNSYGSASLGKPIYAVLATPTAPMAAPWTGVLDDACVWAARTSNATNASKALASGLYASGQYNGGFIQDTDSTTSPETFYLLDFVYYNFAKGTAALYGQCNDFSDFLVCASNAIGAKPLQSQRIIGPFHTNPITASPDPVFADAAFRPWNYHQFTGTTTFFDGCLRFQAYTTPANLPLLTYTNGLVAPGYIYTVLPLFTPIIATSRPIP